MVWRSKILLIILIIVALIAVGYFYKQYSLEKKIKADYEAIAKRIVELQKENEKLEDEIAKSENEEELERLARELYALKKPDENVLIIPQEVMQKIIKEEMTSTSDVTISKISQWWGKIKYFFGNLF